MNAPADPSAQINTVPDVERVADAPAGINTAEADAAARALLEQEAAQAAARAEAERLANQAEQERFAADQAAAQLTAANAAQVDADQRLAAARGAEAVAANQQPIVAQGMTTDSAPGSAANAPDMTSGALDTTDVANAVDAQAQQLQLAQADVANAAHEREVAAQDVQTKTDNLNHHQQEVARSADGARAAAEAAATPPNGSQQQSTPALTDQTNIPQKRVKHRRTHDLPYKVPPKKIKTKVQFPSSSEKQQFWEEQGKAPSNAMHHGPTFKAPMGQIKNLINKFNEMASANEVDGELRPAPFPKLRKTLFDGGRTPEHKAMYESQPA